VTTPLRPALSTARWTRIIGGTWTWRRGFGRFNHNITPLLFIAPYNRPDPGLAPRPKTHSPQELGYLIAADAASITRVLI
jgi:hypothetical protein